MNKKLIQEVSRYTKLVDAGKNQKGKCPFHKEKTASFVINTERQIWCCFGCGLGGNLKYFKNLIKKNDVKPL